MLSSRKIQFSILLITGFIFVSLFAAEPNEPNEPNKPATELKFEMSNFRTKWQLGSATGKGPIRPEYVAEFYIKSTGNLPEMRGTFEKPLQTNVGMSMSPSQKEFLKTSSSYNIMSESSLQKPIGYVGIQLFAVSREDAKKMVQAYIELINEKIKGERDYYEKEILELKEKLSQSKKELPEKEAEFKTIVEEYNSIKEKTHQLSSDTEAADLAKKNIIEMNKTLNELEIELAGVNEKLKAIENYRNDPVSVRPEVFTKLDVMYVELIVELSGIKAKKEMTEKINMMEQRFLSLFSQRNDLEKYISELNSKIKNSPSIIESWTNNLKNNPSMQLLEIYNNTVTIYQVSDR